MTKNYDIDDKYSLKTVTEKVSQIAVCSKRK